MARVALGVAGAVIGTLILPGIGTAAGIAISAGTGAAIGFAVGSAVGDYLFAPTTKAYGPKLDDLSIQGSSYGASIPRVWGAVRIAGQVVWSDGITEHEEKSSSGGGKGGGGGGGSITTYRYTASFAVLLCEGPISGIRRIWADAMLIYDVSAKGSDAAVLSANFATSEVIERVSLYRGTEEQMPDPLIAASERYKDKAAPAYRGRAVLVFENLELEKFGKRIPSISVELFTDGTGGRFLPTRMLDIQENLRGTNYATQNDIVYSIEPGDDSGESAPLAVYKHRFGEAPKLYKTFTITWPGLNAVPAFHQVIAAPGSSDRWFFSVWDNASDIWVTNLHPESLVAVSPLGLGFPFNALAAYVRWEIRNQTLILCYAVGAVGVPTNRQIWTFRHEWKNAQWVELRNFFDGPIGLGDGELFGHYGADLDSLLDVALDPTGERSYYLRAEVRYGLANVLVVYEFETDGKDAPHEIWAMSEDDRKSIGITGHTYLSSSPDGLRVLTSGWLYEIGYSGGERNSYHMDYLRTHGVVDPLFVNNVLAVRSGTNEVWHVPKQAEKDTVALSRVITDVATQCGTTIDTIDIDGLTVSGYTRSRPMSGRAVVEPLQQVHTFDIVEQAAAMRVVKRGGDSVLTVDGTEIVSERDFSKKRAQEIDLPRRLVAQYLSADADFQAGTQQAQRIATRSIVESAVELPIVLTDDEAAKVCEVLLYAAWQSRETIQNISLPPVYSTLEPADVIELNADGASRRVRVTKVGFTAPGLLDISGTVEDQDVYISNAVGGLVEVNEAVLRFTGSTDLLILDTHLLRYGHESSGLYVAGSGGSQWSGAALFVSPNEVNWTRIATIETAAKVGVTLDALPPGPTEVPDLGNKLRVVMTNGTLSSTDDLGFFADVNAALVGEEIITFRDATLVAENTYELAVLSRGRHGTEQHMTHGASETFVLLTSDLVDVSLPPDGKGTKLYFKAVADGQRLDAAETIEHFFTNHRQRPWAPAQLEVVRVSPTRVSATWVYRSRHSGEWSDEHDVPVVDTPERYRVELFRPNPPFVDRLVDSTEVNTPEVELDVQVGDRLEVAQISESWGSGYFASHTIT